MSYKRNGLEEIMNEIQIEKEIKEKLAWLKEERNKFSSRPNTEQVVDKLDFTIRQLQSLTYVSNNSTINKSNENITEKLKQIQQIALSNIGNTKMQFIYQLCEQVLNESK